MQMRLLVEEGGAFIGVTDRWGNTPLDEANRTGARPCAAFLERRLAAQQRGETVLDAEKDLGTYVSPRHQRVCMIH